MLENYIFDFGNVIVRFDSDIIMRPYVKDRRDRETLAPIVFDRKYWDKLDDGTITEEEVFDLIYPQIPQELRNAVKSVFNKWYFDLPVNIEVFDRIKQLKNAGKKIYLLSNISKNFAEGYADDAKLKDIFSYFDGLVFSGAEGMVKPNREIFELILDRYKLDEKKTLFIDDSPKNVDGAEHVGIRTFLFQNNANEIPDE